MCASRMFATAIFFALFATLYLAQSWAIPLGSEIDVQGAVWAAPALARSAKPADIDCNVQVEIPESECNALVTLYNSTNGPGWTDNSDWLVTDTPCSWYGVTCAEGTVQGLDLNANNLVGTIPATLANLTQLQILHLYSNKLNGSIPPELGSLTLLTVLYLSDNRLSGAIPVQLGNLANLQVLYLNNNELTGSLPTQLGNLTQITAIDMDVNQLSGPIPSTLGNLTNLTSLSLNTNQLNGPIPAELGQLSNLQSLILFTNQLTGSIPPELGNLAQLQWLYLSDNQLSGPIPVELSSLANLQYLYLNNTFIDGALPPELGALTQLLDLDISSTWLSGALPKELTNLPLDWFSFHSTYLCIPDDAAIQDWLATISTLLGINTSCSETMLPPLQPATLPDGVPVTIQVSPSQAPAGSTITVSGKGAAGSNQVRLMAVIERQTIGIQEVNLDGSGSYSVQIAVGASYEPGVIQFCALALGLSNAEVACIDFMVQSPAVGSIEGEVRFPAGRIASIDQLNAEFRLLDAAGGTRYSSKITPSNDGGKFSIDNVEPGLYLYGVIGVLPGYVEMGTVEIKPLKPSILPLAVVEQCGIVAQHKPTSVVTANPSRRRLCPHTEHPVFVTKLCA